jgi:hypothetical protein
MSPFRLGRIVLAGVVFAAACRESTGPGTTVVPGAITWIEWPAAVTSNQPVSLRVSGYEPCPYTEVFGVVVEGTDVRVSAQAHVPKDSWRCLDSGSGAGYDTLLTLPTLSAAPGGLPTRFNIWATVAETDFSAHYYANGHERMIGQFTLQFSAPDTSTRFAGIVTLTVDTLGCWRARPWSAWPQPRWVFAKSLSLVPDRASWQAFLSGSIVTVDPPVCGNTVAIDPAALEVDLTPNPYLATAPSRP